jgi:hypothetical protein
MKSAVWSGTAPAAAPALFRPSARIMKNPATTTKMTKTTQPITMPAMEPESVIPPPPLLPPPLPTAAWGAFVGV